MQIEDRSLKALEASLNFRQLRQEILSANVANSETPGYKAKKLDFEDALARAIDIDGQLSLNTNNPLHFNVGSGGFNNLEPDIYDDPNGVVSEDGNTVDRDDQLAQMAENKIMYDAAIQLMSKKLGLLKYTIMSDR